MSEVVIGRHATVARRFSPGLSFSGALSLVAVVSVLVVISVPRLLGLARRENEADARVTAELLAGALKAWDPSATVSMRDLVRRPELASGLADAELLQHGSLLRRHGYLFEVIRLSPSSILTAVPLALFSGKGGLLGGMSAIHAWPWAHGSSGETAFLVTAGGTSLLHPNHAPCLHGLESAGQPMDELEGWRPVH
jgi:hypothetical protein